MGNGSTISKMGHALVEIIGDFACKFGWTVSKPLFCLGEGSREILDGCMMYQNCNQFECYHRTYGNTFYSCIGCSTELIAKKCFGAEKPGKGILSLSFFIPCILDCTED